MLQNKLFKYVFESVLKRTKGEQRERLFTFEEIERGGVNYYLERAYRIKSKEMIEKKTQAPEAPAPAEHKEEKDEKPISTAKEPKEKKGESK